MSAKTTTNVENKPKATVRNFQFVEKLDKVIDKAEKAEEIVSSLSIWSSLALS